MYVRGPTESGMSLLKFLKRTSNTTEHEPPAKHLCSESGEAQADLQLEEAANTDLCEESPDSDCPESSTSSSARSTPSKQSRRFRKVWLVGREQWLEYSRHDRGMFCSLCRRFNKRPFNNDVGTHSRVLGCDFKAYLRTNVASLIKMLYNWQQLLQRLKMWCQL